jgi:ribosome-binding protein aMBF1 (putative translation factor)
MKLGIYLSFWAYMPIEYFQKFTTLLSMNNLRNQQELDDFGAKLNKLRVSKNLTLEQLAFEAEMELSQVHRIEKGKINPTLTTLNALARGLKISLAELVG